MSVKFRISVFWIMTPYSWDERFVIIERVIQFNT